MAFLEGQLPAPERSTVERHLDACPPCTELTIWAAAEHAHPSRRVGDEGRPFVGGLLPGSCVDRYQILGAIGRGGMGEVYAAYHPDLDRRIALKVVHESGAHAPERRARLLREARAIARLSHPNVVSVHDAGTVGDRVYIAMEFIEGETVDTWLRSKPRGWREIVDVFISAGRGLAAAHAAGVVHRDFKPQNVMVGRDGSVRVMDFGLARLAHEPAELPDRGGAHHAPSVPTTVTETGALVGTLAYMAPEQFHREQIDPRADQFSFCVALHEAIHGRRPALAHLAAEIDAEEASSAPSTSTPSWLRALTSRGIAVDREQRFPSMEMLVRALIAGRGRLRRRTSGASFALAVLLVALASWRIASGGRVSCTVPTDRLARVWSGSDDGRRKATRRGLTRDGQPLAETTWQRISQALDVYVQRWSAKYVEACEATHVRSEQSAEVLDLRMACLSENLDEVRALTDLFVDGSVPSAKATIAVQDLASLSHCDDVAALRSSIPPPKDDQTARIVRELRAAINDVRVLDDTGNYRTALEKALALKPRIESVQYKPLLGQLLTVIGAVESESDPNHAEIVLQEAVATANGSRDDVTAALAASTLVYILGYKAQKPTDGHRWARMAHAFLDRTGVAHKRVRSWIVHNEAIVYAEEGNLDLAHRLMEEALALKEQVLGNSHPDAARSLGALCAIALEAHHPKEAVRWCDRSYTIAAAADSDSALLASASNNRAEALNALGLYDAAEADFRLSMRIIRLHYGADHERLAFPLQGLGDLMLARKRPAAAVGFLEEALSIREQHHAPKKVTADTQFALARALWESGSDRRRAELMARAAADGYARTRRSDDEKRVVTWLTDQRRTRRRPSFRDAVPERPSETFF